MRVPFLRNERNNIFPTHKKYYFTFVVVLLLVIAFFLSVYCSAQVYAQCGTGSSTSSGSDTSSVPQPEPDPKSDSPDWVKDPFGTKPGSVPEPKPEPKPDSGPEQVPEPKPEPNPEINTPSDSTSNQPDYDSESHDTYYDPNEDLLESRERELKEWLESLDPDERKEVEYEMEHGSYYDVIHEDWERNPDVEIPWWVPPTIEAIDDVTDYLPGKPIINAIGYLQKKPPEYFQAFQEIISIPTAWVGTFISHVQKLTGTELTMENVQYMFTLAHDDNKPFQEWTDEEIRMVDPLYIPLQEDKVDTPYHW